MHWCFDVRGDARGDISDCASECDVIYRLKDAAQINLRAERIYSSGGGGGGGGGVTGSSGTLSPIWALGQSTAAIAATHCIAERSLLRR